MKQGLDNITVLEVGTTVVAPYASQILGALGAEVVKIERPGGDPFREAAPETESGMSGYFALCNSGKRSITLDLKKEEGKDLFLYLAEECDVIIENLRPGAVDRLGIGYQDVKDLNEDVIYCSISGYGQDGPRSHLPGFDPVLQGVTGLMSTTGEKGGPPIRVGVAVIDLMTATWSTIAIMNAIHHRQQSDDGSYIDMSMYDVGVAMLTKKATQYWVTGENPERMGTEDEWAAPYGAYPTKDDRQIIIGTPWQELWERLCREIDHEELLQDDRFSTNPKRVQNRAQLNEILNKIFKERTLEEWLDILEEEIPAGPIEPVSEALNNDQSEYSNVKTHFEKGLDVLNLPLRIDEERHEFEVPPPDPGEDTVSILEEYGISGEEIDELKEKNVI